MITAHGSVDTAVEAMKRGTQQNKIYIFDAPRGAAKARS